MIKRVAHGYLFLSKAGIVKFLSCNIDFLVVVSVRFEKKRKVMYVLHTFPVSHTIYPY